MRRQRTATESVGSIVLAFEVIVIGLGALVAFGLHAATPAQAFGGGAVLLALALVTVPLLRYPWGVWLGWLVQALVLASGIWVHMMFVVGILFVGVWAYAMISAARADRARALQQGTE